VANTISFSHYIITFKRNLLTGGGICFWLGCTYLWSLTMPCSCSYLLFFLKSGKSIAAHITRRKELPPIFMVKPGLKNEKPLGSKSRQDSLLEEHSVLLRKTTTKNWPRKQLRQTTNKRGRSHQRQTTNNYEQLTTCIIVYLEELLTNLWIYLVFFLFPVWTNPLIPQCTE